MFGSVCITCLALLSLIAWSERGSAVNRKDARDLSLLLSTYLSGRHEGAAIRRACRAAGRSPLRPGGRRSRILARDLASMQGRIRVRLEENSGSSKGPCSRRAATSRPATQLRTGETTDGSLEKRIAGGVGLAACETELDYRVDDKTEAVIRELESRRSTWLLRQNVGSSG
jgi:hypothetical protein